MGNPREATPKEQPTPEEVCRSLVPDSCFGDVMEALASSIELVNRYSRERWGMSYSAINVMLKIGTHEVMQLWEGPFHIVLDRDTLPDVVADMDDLDWSGDLSYYGEPDEGYYPSNPGTVRCHMPYEMVGEVYPAVLESHKAVIARAALLRRNPTTRRTHSPELVAYISSVVGRPLQQPAYATTRSP